MFGPETKFKEKKVFSAEEKKRIMQELNEKRQKEQKSKEAIKRYFSDKKIYRYKGGEYYKVSDYKQSFYIDASVIRKLADTVQEVDLERSGYMEKRTQKGFIKWDCIRECILISPDRVKVYYRPFHVEKIR